MSGHDSGLFLFYICKCFLWFELDWKAASYSYILQSFNDTLVELFYVINRNRGLQEIQTLDVLTFATQKAVKIFLLNFLLSKITRHRKALKIPSPLDVS